MRLSERDYISMYISSSTTLIFGRVSLFQGRKEGRKGKGTGRVREGKEDGEGEGRSGRGKRKGEKGKGRGENGRRKEISY